ncbi:MAG: hypothetical protein R3F49_19820 [Planctomycetota bacterium]
MSPLPVVIGCAVAAALLLLGWQPWRRGAERPVGPLASALAAPVAALVTLYANAGRVALPPRVYLDWVFVLGALAVALVALRDQKPRAALGLFGAGAAFLAVYPTQSLHERYWGDQRVLWMLGLTAALVAAFLIARAALRARRADGAAALSIAALASAPALGLSGTGSGALLVASVGGAAALVAGLGYLRRDLAPWSGFAATFAALHAGIVASGVLYAETPRWSGLALVLAPALVLIPGSSKRLRLARLALVVVAVGIAAWQAKGAPNPYGGY